MEKNLKKKEKRLARSKRHDEKRAKSKRTKRSRLSARKARQEAKMLRDVARAAMRKERKLKQIEAERPLIMDLDKRSSILY